MSRCNKMHYELCECDASFQIRKILWGLHLEVQYQETTSCCLFKLEHRCCLVSELCAALSSPHGL